jgi:hypothetical protein
MGARLSDYKALTDDDARLAGIRGRAPSESGWAHFLALVSTVSVSAAAAPFSSAGFA